MKVLGRDEILGASDIKRELVQVPEWGEDAAVWVRSLTAKERDDYERSMIVYQNGKNKPDLSQARAKLAAAAICDENGVRLFTDADVKALGDKSASALQRVFEVAQRLSGITGEDVEELVKNSESGH